MNEIKCPYDLNQFILGEPIFENPFTEEECGKRKFYGGCFHCFSTAIASRDKQLLKAKEETNQSLLYENERLLKSVQEMRAEIEINAKKFNRRPEISYNTAYSDGLSAALTIIDKHMSWD